MPSYLTDTQIAALNLSGTASQIAATLSDAATVYAYVQANPWATDAAALAWAQSQWGSDTGSSLTPAQRLQAAATVLTQCGRLFAITSAFQPIPRA